jgi:phosphatidylserine decarboxylase
MELVKVQCDRCKKTIQGFEGVNDQGAHWTAGFYRITHDGPWAKYAKLDETIVCDQCMAENEAYQADYGHKDHD